MKTLEQGQRVNTPEGPGRVAYVRMSALSGYTEPCAVSVVLDSRRDRIGYKGTIFVPSNVTPIEEE